MSACDQQLFDFESKRGRFGWEVIDTNYIPYILRLMDKYCALRIANKELLNRYLHILDINLFKSVRILVYQPTQSEVILLNEINSNHCDEKYGKPFTRKDYIIRLEDVKLFYEYFSVCRHKLFTIKSDLRDRCGFLLINNVKVVPYIKKDNNIVMPVFFLENRSSISFRTGIFVSGWDAQYLKFIIAMHGEGSKNFLNQSIIEVITLDDVRNRCNSNSNSTSKFQAKLYWLYIAENKFIQHKSYSQKQIDDLWTVEANDFNTMTNVSNNNNNNKNLIEYGKPLKQIMEMDPDDRYSWHPYNYNIVKLRLGPELNYNLPCINIIPYVSINSEPEPRYLLTTLPDFARLFLKGVSLMKCKEFLDFLNIDLYRGNSSQMELLWIENKCLTTNDYLPLIRVEDIEKNLSKFQLVHQSECN